MIFILVGWPYLLYTLISKILGVEERNISNILSTFIPYTISATILWLTHYRIMKKISSPNLKSMNNDQTENDFAPKNSFQTPQH